MILLAIILAGLGTYLSRALFILLLSRHRFPALAVRVLGYVAPAVMGALVVSMLTGVGGEVLMGPAELVGLVCAGAVAWRTRNHIYTLLVGMASFWLVGFVL